MMQTAYPDQPHGRPIIGTEKTLRAMTVQQLAAYRDEFYVPNNVVFSAAGPIKHEDFVAIVEKKYGSMPSKEFPPLPKPSYKGGVAVDEMESANLCNVVLGMEAVPSNHPDAIAYEALGGILGGGSSSPLYREVVIRKELSADVGSYISDYRNAGMMDVVTHVAPDKIRPFAATAYAELRKLSENVNQEDLDKAKANMEMGLLKSMETNGSVCNALACSTLIEGKLVTQQDMLERIRKLTVDDIKRVAKKLLASAPTLAMIVPPGTDRKYVPTEEELIAMRDGKAPKPQAPARKKKI
jgi:predicted Zn-dependent peptidase